MIAFGVLLLGLLASAYFSMVEIALISASRLRLRQEAREGSVGARLALSLLSDRERVLATTLVGINLANLTVGALATSLLHRALTAWAAWKVNLLATGGATLVILVGAEIVPKVYGRQRADKVLTSLARPITATEQLFIPLTGALRAYVGLLLRILRRRPRSPLLTREDLRLLVHEVKGEGGDGRKENKMLRSILDFGETTVREVMVPMPEVVSLERQATGDQLRALVRRHGFTRMPVYERRVDQVVGLVNIYDLLFDPQPKESVEKYMRPVTLVPETKRIDRLMVEMQRERQTMAVVVSEFGSCIGVVTMEDIVEEIVGELEEERESGVPKIRPAGHRTWLADALTDLDDVNEELGCELPKGRYDTIGGLVLKHFGRLPRRGESFEISGVKVEVLDTHPYGVRTVKLVLPEREEH